MGGFMSPMLAILMCCLVEMGLLQTFPSGLIGGYMRYMDDVLGVMAVASDAEEARARWWFNTVKNGYPAPLQLNVKPGSGKAEFLELLVVSNEPGAVYTKSSNHPGIWHTTSGDGVCASGDPG